MTEQPETVEAASDIPADVTTPDVDLTNPEHVEDDDPDALAGEELEDDGLDDETDGDDDA